MDPPSLPEKIRAVRIVSFRDQPQRLFSTEHPPRFSCAGKVDVKAPMWKTAVDKAVA